MIKIDVQNVITKRHELLTGGSHFVSLAHIHVHLYLWMYFRYSLAFGGGSIVNTRLVSETGEHGE